MSERRYRVLTIVAIVIASIGCAEIAGLLGQDHSLIPLPVMVRAAMIGAPDALIAIGIVLVYRASRIINFAQASFGIVAASLFANLVVLQRWNYWFALAAALAAAVVAGVLVEVLLVRRFARAPRLVLTVVTLAVAQLLGGIAYSMPAFFGIDIEQDPVPADRLTTPFTRFRSDWFPETFNGDDAAALIAGVVAFAALGAFLRFSSAGIAVRGAAENEERAAQLGVSTRNLSTLVWAMAAGLSGVAVLLQAPIQRATVLTVVTGVGAISLLRALAAAIIGRMEDLSVTIAAALGIAVFERSVFWATSQTSLVHAALLGVILVALLFQRQRLGRADELQTTSWAATEEIRAVPKELAAHPSVRRSARWVVAIGAILVLGYPWVMSPSQVNLGGIYAIFGIIAVSLVVLTGWGGQISLGQFAFVAVGAAVGGALSSRLGWPFLVVLPLGSLAGSAAAVILGLPALRIRGLFLAVTTMSFAVVVNTVFLDERYFGWMLPDTVSRPKLLFVDTEDERAFYYLAVAGLVFAVWVARGLRRTRTGRALIAMRDNERAAQSLGSNLVRTRLATFAISGFLAAFAGVLFAYHQHGVSQPSFIPEFSIGIFLMAVIGGLGSVGGVLLGPIYFGTVTVLIGGVASQLLASGLGVLVVLMLFPGGLGAVAASVRDSWLRRLAIRDRIFVPSLVGDHRVLDAAHAQAALAPKFDDRGMEVKELPVRYRIPSRIGATGASQEKEGWRYT